jgi:glycosyltransferase involved in cell wall biosynthesis
MESKKSISVCVIIPAFNESKVISKVVSDIQSKFAKQPYDYQVVVVDDKSTDNTAAEAYQANVHVVRHLLNQGAGGATSTGLRYSAINNFDYAITMDADGQHQANDAIACLKNAIDNNTDLLIGSRLIDKRGMSRVKVLGNRGLTFITWLLFRVSVTDSQSGLRVFSRKSLRMLEWKSTGYEFCSEMIWRADQLGLTIKEHPITAIYTDYSVSKGQNNWNGINIVKSLLRRRIVEMFE